MGVRVMRQNHVVEFLTADHELVLFDINRPLETGPLLRDLVRHLIAKTFGVEIDKDVLRPVPTNPHRCQPRTNRCRSESPTGGGCANRMDFVLRSNGVPNSTKQGRRLPGQTRSSA